MNIFKLTVSLLAATTVLGTLLPVPVRAGPTTWQQQLGTPGDESARDVATDSAGNVYLTGYTSGSLAGSTQGGNDIWLAKYDTNGTQLWQTQLGTSSDEKAYSVAVDSTGGVYVTGTTKGSLAAPNQGGNDIWLAKYNTNGTQLWQTQLGTSGEEDSNAIAVDSTDNVYIAGMTTGSLAAPNQGGNDIWLAKYNTNGTQLWQKQFGAYSYQRAYGVAVDSTGVYVSGTTSGTFAGPSPAGTAALVAKFHSNGALLWQKQLGTPVNDVAYEVATDGTGNVYVSGASYGSLAGSNNGGADAWVAEYDTNGTLKWKKQLGTPSFDDSQGVAAISNGSDSFVYITGYTAGALGGPNNGLGDAWVAAYDSTGLLRWKKQLGTTSSDLSYSVAIHINARNFFSPSIYLSGSTYGALTGANHGGEDAWVAKAALTD